MANEFFEKSLALLSRLTQSIKELLFALALGLVVALMIFNYSLIEQGFRALVNSLGRGVERLEFGVFKLVISNDGVAANLISDRGKILEIISQAPEFSSRRADELMLVAEQISHDFNQLDARTLTRLMSIGLLENLCHFDIASAEVMENATADRRLKEKGLVEIISRPELTKKVLAEIRRKEAEENRKSDIGYPRDCYEMTLTERGWNVRTELVSFLRSTIASKPLHAELR